MTTKAPRWIALATLAAAALLVAFDPDARTFIATACRLLLNPNVVQGVTDLQAFLLPYGDRAWIITSALMILQSLAAPIPAVPLTLVNALIYGPWLGALISWSAAETAAALCFGLARWFGRPFVVKLFRPALIERLDGFFARDGLAAVVVLRLVPYVSFDLVSWAGGLTNMRLLPFLLATGVGQAPATLVYSFAGAAIVTDPRHALKLALVFLGTMALLAGLFVVWRRRRTRAA
ncbi:MAG: TVP38/TMEM64 family protein [Planctomycetes bacterium]|nr:TVP38/TMEM64 family protein [Planctomycetota bacterium]